MDKFCRGAPIIKRPKSVSDPAAGSGHPASFWLGAIALIVAVLASTLLFLHWQDGQRMRIKFPPRALGHLDATGPQGDNPNQGRTLEAKGEERWGVSLVGAGTGKGGQSSGGKRLAGKPYQPSAHY